MNDKEEPADEAKPRMKFGPGFIMNDPAIIGSYAIVIYLPDEDRFVVYRGATAEDLEQ